uniref:DUF488 family protein n=1 Tax=candidate division WOR-3 bacterium TaxID=2052148 RepID=A0A7C4CBR3_UNCW3
MRLYTLGTAHRKSYDFTRLLYKYGIQVIFDLRAMPEGEEEHFNRGGLEQLCSSVKVSYVFLGNELGRPHGADYRQWVKTEEFRRSCSIIGRKVPLRVCCLLCSEKSPEYCPRRVIGDELAKQGIEVIHVLDENVFWQPGPARQNPRPPLRRRGRR